MNCKDMLLKISLYIDNELQDNEREEVEEHLNSCENCRNLLNQWKQNDKILQENLRDIQPSEKIVDNVMISIKRHKRYDFLKVKFKNVFYLTVAALVFILISASLYINLRYIEPIEIVVIGQTNLSSGGRTSFRLLIKNPESSKPLANRTAKLTFVSSKGEGIPIGDFNTDKRGEIVCHLDIPDVENENYRLVAVVGKTKSVTPIRIRRDFKILLTTDKPIYQPCQTIHIRTLALSSFDLKPVKSKNVLFEVEDPKGNKVYKKEVATSEFGIASCDFELADEINLGNYRITASIRDVKSEKVVEVKRYVLPKFRVDVETDKTYYQPGQILKGVVKSEYFFGKPVANGTADISLGYFVVDRVEVVVRLKEKLDEKGFAKFEVEIPEKLFGSDIAKGDVIFSVKVTVTDNANHKEEKIHNVTVSSEALKLYAVPESGDIVPGVENIVYIIATYPDGSPAEADVKIGNSHIKTDKTGVGKFLNEIGLLSFRFEASDKFGNKAEGFFKLESSKTNFILRTDKVSYKTGETVKIKILSTRKEGVIYLDIVKGGNTILTKDIELKDGLGEYLFDIPQDLFGTVRLNVWRIDSYGTIHRDTRVIFVDLPKDLIIRPFLDKEKYRPGETITVNFEVSDDKGKPVQSALGITAVDEAVFALQEVQPGFEKIYFALESDLLKPRYQIKGYSPSILTEPTPETDSQNIVSAVAEELSDVKVVQKVDNLSIINAMKKETKKFNKIVFLWIPFFVISGVILIYGIIPVIKRVLKKIELLTFEAICALCLIFIFVSLGVIFLPDTFRGARKSARKKDIINMMKQTTKLIEPEELTMEDVKNEVEESDENFRTPKIKTKSAFRVRRYFPETLIWRPELITDEDGRATLTVDKPADSITTWRLITQGVTKDGKLGSHERGIVVFQDFFVDIDLPVSLLQDDEVSIPISIYNYLKEPQEVAVRFEKQDWFDLLERDEIKEISLPASDVGVLYFRIKVKSVGLHKLTVYAVGSKGLKDAIEKTIQVLPNGKEFEININEKISQRRVTHKINIPENAIDNASVVLVRLYPGRYSEVVQGLDALVRLPYGCFEQTSSIAYPNVLVMGYMKATGQLTPEKRMDFEHKINLSYQRILSFEVRESGGFDWYGNPPAKIILSAYGILLLNDMAKVYPTVDGSIIDRAYNFLRTKQIRDGSWALDAQMETWQQLSNERLPLTAYITWALAEAGYHNDTTFSAGKYIEEHLYEAEDPYVQALCANALVALYKDQNKYYDEVLKKLRDSAIVKDEVAYWTSSMQGVTYSTGRASNLEATALACYAFLKANKEPTLVQKVLNYISRSKDAFGSWYSTQTTILCIKTLLEAAENFSSLRSEGEIKIFVNGVEIENAFEKITRNNWDVMQQVNISKFLVKGENEIQIFSTDDLNVKYQIAGRYFIPWDEVQREEKFEPLTIDIDYDKTTLSVDDSVKATVRIDYKDAMPTSMVIVDLSIPPGFIVETSDFEELVAKKVIDKYNLTGRQITVYLGNLDRGTSKIFKYRLRAKYPIKAKSPESKVYEYYNPEKSDTTEPVEFVVRKE